jgi:hypothetical protein
MLEWGDFSFWGHVDDMFYECYKSDAGKLFVVSGDKKTVMQWQPKSSW